MQCWENFIFSVTRTKKDCLIIYTGKILLRSAAKFDVGRRRAFDMLPV